jgi:muramidase (phage lysozyme)
MRDAIAIIGLLDDANVKAFLRVIRAGESSQDDGAYRWLFGSTRSAPKLFESFADHPRVRTYEAYDGQFIANGKIDYTTAAGAYQITETTWNGVSKCLGLEDFSERSQDIAAVGLVDGRGALDDVLAGNVERAMFLCRQEWASLPASTYGQPTQSTANALTVYRHYGGQTGSASTQEAPMPAPILVAAGAAVLPDMLRALANGLINVFSPLAKEKLTEKLAKHSNDPEVTGQIVNSIIDTAKTLTAKSDPMDAVLGARSDPAIIQQCEENALATLERLAPLLDKIAQWDKQSWDAEEASRDMAAARARLDPHDQDVFLTKAIVGMVLGLMVALGALVAFLVYVKASESTIGTMLGLFSMATGVIVGEFKTRYQHRYGSSRSSGAKDVMIGELSRRKGG